MLPALQWEMSLEGVSQAVGREEARGWEGRAGILVHSCLKEGLLRAPRNSEKGPLWQSEQMARKFCKSRNHSSYNLVTC